MSQNRVPDSQVPVHSTKLHFDPKPKKISNSYQISAESVIGSGVGNFAWYRNEAKFWYRLFGTLLVVE